jgi:P-type Mg2+ transporter
MALSAERERGAPTASWRSLQLKAAATMDCDAVLAELGSTPEGLSTDEAGRRLADVGANALRSHGARPLDVLARQFKNPLLILLIGTALVSAFVGETTNAVIILSIVGLSVGLGFVNEYRSERAVEELHSQLPAHRACSAQRQARHCRRDHAGPGRRGRARRRRCGTSRSAAAAGR